MAKRKENRDKAQVELEKATEAGDAETMDKMNRRLVKVTSEHNDECKRLLKLMGIPFVDVSKLYLSSFDLRDNESLCTLDTFR